MIYEDRTVGLELWAVELLNCTEVTTLAKVWSATVYYLPASLYYLQTAVIHFGSIQCTALHPSECIIYASAEVF